ncbi:MAG: uncharacterized protein KVP18_004464 [Porospora cf. gigantea A]|uniref:uncharacterized protein n=1 Tax=Porospora cf. gigantea A TaxID=2853593 RepID=UPI0035595DC0|nr:MAG: hypothetical protein KVP18_004464 [Porospora cf. gigantea A]
MFSTWKCTTCAVAFDTPAEHREHHRSEWHRYNIKRAAAGFDAVTQEVFLRKLELLASNGDSMKGTAHRKNRQEMDFMKGAAQKETETPLVDPATLPMNRDYEVTFCLFDNTEHPQLDDMIAYMEETYSFFIPDQEFLVDKKGLISYLGGKLWYDHQCIFCNRVFKSLQDVWRHMKDSGHTMIGTEDEDMQDELAMFYDYSKSYQKLVLKKPEQVAVASALSLKDTSATKPQVEIAPKIVDALRECLSGESDWEDESEPEDWEEVLNDLGLQAAHLSRTGNLILPGGAEVAHRDVAWAYKQKHVSQFTSKSEALLKLKEHRAIENAKSGRLECIDKDKMAQTVQGQRQHQYDYVKVGVAANKLQTYFKRQDVRFG